jgi:hypothetical protein
MPILARASGSAPIWAIALAVLVVLLALFLILGPARHRD